MGVSWVRGYVWLGMIWGLWGGAQLGWGVGAVGFIGNWLGCGLGKLGSGCALKTSIEFPDSQISANPKLNLNPKPMGQQQVGHLLLAASNASAHWSAYMQQ